ncbi:magnesium transporter CorA family protein [Novispirillum sp. DQ9]|uniref:magnesium transporter CorA family protein n=1 Tax=Novispirillum sp. DQ9 TaxID=3398612 RepID=UPI003C7E9B41
MLTVYVPEERGLSAVIPPAQDPVPAEAVWMDLYSPSAEEVVRVERALGILLPTREEMQEIEASSRLYVEDGAVFMTAVVLSQSETDHPQLAAMTFILAGGRLVTIRHSEPRPFKVFAARAQRQALSTGQQVLTGLLEAIIDRAADILERVGAEMETLSRSVFAHSKVRAQVSRDFQDILAHIGLTGDLNSRAAESLMSIGRVLAFLSASNGGGGAGKANKELRQSVKVMWRDVQSLLDHANFLSDKITFLLDATLGMIGIEQSTIIKIFSVVAVIFLPPTLVASIYGMNFDVMPELSWPFGYPFAVGLMLVSAALPYLYFKRRGWL